MYSHTVVSYCIDYRNGSQLLNSHNAGLQQTDHIPHKWNWSLDSSKHRIEHRKNKSDQQYFHQNCNKLIESKETMQLDHIGTIIPHHSHLLLKIQATTFV